VKFTFILDPLDRLDPGHDSTVALMEAAQQQGHEVWVTQASQLGVAQGRAQATVQQIQLDPVVRDATGLRWVAPMQWYHLCGSPCLAFLDEMDVVLMRTDPPVNVPYLYATYILDAIDPRQTLVMNAPSGLRQANEKMYALQFAAVIPTTIVSAAKAEIRAFVEMQQRAVLKPIGGKAGEGILFLEAGDRNLNSLIELSTQQGQLPVMVQQFLPEAKAGDKRIIVLNGEPIGAINRIPTGDEFRGNMAVGGRVAAVEITERDREICQTVAPRLQADGLYFVGLDVIGGYLTEVNVTSPTGIREVDLFNHVSLGLTTVQWIEARLNQLRSAT